ncbi:MAG: alpha/beta fold hydrolase [Balneola sp.]|jgi:pimeloyl-ACP methyl ester carboxylesterase
MKKTVSLSSLILLFFLPILATAQVDISFETEDGVTIYGYEYLHSDKEAPVILLFHQGGGNALAEYSIIIPKLLEAGFSAIAVDQRVGGSYLGGENKTAKTVEFKDGYCHAYPDLVATLNYALGKYQGKKIIVWGSSYSASLATKLTAEYPDKISGLLSFSPASGGPMVDCKADLFSGKVTVPTIFLRPASEMEREASIVQFELFKEQGHRVYIAENGVHGSSMLNPERVDGPVERQWDVVLSFLKSIEK